MISKNDGHPSEGCEPVARSDPLADESFGCPMVLATLSTHLLKTQNEKITSKSCKFLPTTFHVCTSSGEEGSSASGSVLPQRPSRYHDSLKDSTAIPSPFAIGSAFKLQPVASPLASNRWIYGLRRIISDDLPNIQFSKPQLPLPANFSTDLMGIRLSKLVVKVALDADDCTNSS